MSSIITRASWGARYGDGRAGATYPASEIWLHHSVTHAPEPGATFTQDCAAIRTIEDIGAQRFGQSYGFPYTFGITPSGRIFAGHDVTKLGAHTVGHNAVARAVVLVGDYTSREPTPAQLDSTAWLIRYGLAAGWWTVGQLTGGHRDVKATECPGDRAYAAIGEINRRARDGDAPAPELPTLRYGMRDNPAVANLQAFLARTFPSYAGSLPATGNYLDQTRAAVAEFQRRASREGWPGLDGPDADGSIVGGDTNRALAGYGYRA
jgi:hypothetical protein